MRIIVCDTGPLIHLYESNALTLLRLAGQVHIPPVVQNELATIDSTWRQRPPNWISVNRLSEPYSTNAITWQQAGLADIGEAEAIALAQYLEADWLLTDDAAARVFAQSFGIEVHGSLGIVLWAAAVGHIGRTEATGTLNRLYNSSLWISAAVRAEADEALERLFAGTDQ